MRDVNPADRQQADEPLGKENPEPGSAASTFGQTQGQAEDGYTDDTQ
jgi:hypothetical protein